MKRKDLTGQVFGRLEVLRFSRFGNRRASGIEAFWLCECSCGNTVEVEVHLLRNKKRSCGCLKRETLDSLHLKKRCATGKGEAELNIVLNRYRQRAKRNGIEFTLDKELFRQLTSASCAYCGAAPQIADNRYSSQKCNGRYAYTGLDRKDPMKGYTAENVVSCCIVCNRAKNTMTVAAYVQWMDSLAKFRNAKELAS